MRIDAGHAKWAAGTAGALLVGTLLYAVNARWAPAGATGGSPAGLAFGVAGSALIVFAALIGARRRRPAWRVGRAATWLKGHLWLGALSLPLILFHAGFSRGGPLTTACLVLLVVVVASGLAGLALQQVLPRLMTDRVPLETVYEEIPHVLAQLRDEADALVAANALVTAPGADALQEIHRTRIRPYLDPGGRGRDAELARASSAEIFFERVRPRIPETAHETLGELALLCDERRQLALQARLHLWLHGWLLVHAPLTMALLVLAAVHAVSALRYGTP